MEAKSRFKVKLSNEAQEFLDGLPNKGLLIGDAGRAVFHMDDAATDKAVLLEKMLHDLVVGVGVGPQALTAVSYTHLDVYKRQV